jgi:hypothetical protein
VVCVWDFDRSSRVEEERREEERVQKFGLMVRDCGSVVDWVWGADLFRKCQSRVWGSCGRVSAWGDGQISWKKFKVHGDFVAKLAAMDWI